MNKKEILKEIERLQEERAYHESLMLQDDATQASVKIFLNTMSYGFLAFGGGSFNDYGEAERITTNGQKIVKDMINIIQNDGGVPIKVDTDGVALRMPKEWEGREEEYCEVRLTDALPEGIEIECDGKYDGILSFDGKSYALLEKDGTIKIKGNTLIGRSIETFLTNFTRECIHELFYGDENCSKILDNYMFDVQTKNILAKDIAKRKNINMTLDEYQTKNKSGNTQTLAQYELAIKAIEEGTRQYGKGDVIYYYIKQYPYILTTHRGKPAIKKPKLKNFESCELIENYNFDFEESYYVERLESAAKKFMALGKDKFEKIFDMKIYPKAADKRKYENLTDLKWEMN